jgi:transcriptional regulator with XRE-family HTH domain
MAKKTKATYDDQSHIFVSHITELLNKRGMTRTRLAELAGIRPNVITELERLQRNTINIYHLSAIATALGVTDITRLISIKQEAADDER